MTRKVPIIILLLFMTSIFSIVAQADETNDLVAEAESVAVVSDGVSGVEASVEIGQGDDGVSEASAHTSAIAVAEQMHLTSRAFAQGKQVKGGGEAKLTSPQDKEGYVSVSVITNAMEHGVYSIEVVAEVIGNGIGETLAWVWADNKDNVVVSQAPPQNDFISGYIFGHSDSERYWHFKKQALLNCYDGVNESGFKICARAVYNMEILLDRNGENQTTFELKYGLNETIRIRDMLINISRK